MKSKKDLQNLIKEIKAKTGKTQAEISSGAGYKAKTITQVMSKGEGLESVYNHLKLVYKEELKNSTSEAKVSTEVNIAASLTAITRALWNLENGQAYIRAEIRGYGQYHILKELEWDQERFLTAMAEVGKLIGANLKADDLRGS